MVAARTPLPSTSPTSEAQGHELPSLLASKGPTSKGKPGNVAEAHDVHATRVEGPDMRVEDLAYALDLAIFAYSDDTEARSTKDEALVAACGSAEQAAKPLSAILRDKGLIVDRIFSHSEVFLFGAAVADTQGYIAHNDQDVIIAFRGTHDSAMDWLTNIQCAKTAWEPDADYTTRGFSSYFDIFGSCSEKPKVHRGIYNAFLRTIPDINDVLIPLLQGSRKRLVVVGHSLGGALALACVAYCMKKILGRRQNPLLLATFGQPRFGDDKFLCWIEKELLELERTGIATVVRVVNDADIVPTFPPAAMGFRHDREHTCVFNDAGELHVYPEHSEVDGSFDHLGELISDHWRTSYHDCVKGLAAGSRLVKGMKCSRSSNHFSLKNKQV